MRKNRKNSITISLKSNGFLKALQTVEKIIKSIQKIFFCFTNIAMPFLKITPTLRDKFILAFLLVVGFTGISAGLAGNYLIINW
jgi:hypothetical protein